MANAEGQILFVGSLGVEDAETAFRMLGERIGVRAKRYPDGEPGERGYWIRWQNAVFANHPDFELVDSRTIEGYKDAKQRPMYRLRDGADPGRLDIGALGYAKAALESWKAFSRLRGDGAIPAETRLQVCLPTCGALLTSFFEADQARVVEPALELAMKAEVGAIAGAVPAADLAIQWDVAYEVIAHDGGQPPLHYGSALAGSVERIVRQIGWVPPGVEAGVHLCYGDPGHKHVVEPEDLGTCVAFGNEICAKADRPITWVHMPVPRGRTDAAYYAPLDGLQIPAETEFYVGCIHFTDGVEGTRKRLEQARRHVSDFGLATECGFGRREPNTISALVDIHVQAAAL